MLSKQHCCGNYLYRPVIKDKDQEDMDECLRLVALLAGSCHHMHDFTGFMAFYLIIPAILGFICMAGFDL